MRVIYEYLNSALYNITAGGRDSFNYSVVAFPVIHFPGIVVVTTYRQTGKYVTT